MGGGEVEGASKEQETQRKAEEARAGVSNTARLVEVMILMVLFLELPSILSYLLF